MNENYQNLFVKYLEDALSEEETERLLNAIKRGENIEKLLPEEIYAQSPMLNSDIEIDKALVYEKLKSRLYPRQSDLSRRKVYFFQRAWIRYAAAVLTVFGIGAYLWNSQRPKFPPPSAGLAQKTSEIPSGGNKAVLTLADGSTISLDSALKGRIAEQGSFAIQKTADGEIVYQPEPDKPMLSGFNSIGTPRGGQYKLRLPDGSDVWLNASSSITYPTIFQGSERRVKITGEVYFEIAKDKAMPFIVERGKVEVRVYGTHFNINTYDDEEDVKVTLLEGSVKVSVGLTESSLLPGQQAQVKKDSRITLVKDADTEAAVAWKNGYFELKGYSIEELMRQVSRWYDVEIEYEGAPPKRQFAGQLERSLNLSETLHILEESNVHFVLKGRRVIVRP